MDGRSVDSDLARPRSRREAEERRSLRAAADPATDRSANGARQPAEGIDEPLDIVVNRGRIESIGEDLEQRHSSQGFRQVIDARGGLVVPARHGCAARGRASPVTWSRERTRLVQRNASRPVAGDDVLLREQPAYDTGQPAQPVTFFQGQSHEVLLLRHGGPPTGRPR